LGGETFKRAFPPKAKPGPRCPAPKTGASFIRGFQTGAQRPIRKSRGGTGTPQKKQTRGPCFRRLTSPPFFLTRKHFPRRAGPWRFSGPTGPIFNYGEGPAIFFSQGLLPLNRPARRVLPWVFFFDGPNSKEKSPKGRKKKANQARGKKLLGKNQVGGRPRKPLVADFPSGPSPWGGGRRSWVAAILLEKNGPGGRADLEWGPKKGGGRIWVSSCIESPPPPRRKLRFPESFYQNRAFDFFS